MIAAFVLLLSALAATIRFLQCHTVKAAEAEVTIVTKEADLLLQKVTQGLATMAENQHRKARKGLPLSVQDLGLAVLSSLIL